jgi:hypothetical protein
LTADCLACGKPLGGSTGLCYSCEQEEIEIEDAIDVDESIAERVERYFIVSSVSCANCGDLHGEVTVGGKTYTADDFGIETIEEWKLEMDKEEEWLQDNARAVRAVLPHFESEWPQTVHAVRTYFFN